MGGESVQIYSQGPQPTPTFSPKVRGATCLVDLQQQIAK